MIYPLPAVVGRALKLLGGLVIRKGTGMVYPVGEEDEGMGVLRLSYYRNQVDTTFLYIRFYIMIFDSIRFDSMNSRGL